MSPSLNTSSAALPIAHRILRFLIVLNWFYGAGIVALLVVSVTNESFFISVFQIPPPPETERVLRAFRAIMLLGIATVPLNFVILNRLLAIVETVRFGDPFVGANAHRLQTIGWVLIALNLFSIVIGAIAAFASTPAYPIDMDAGFSLNGWLAVLLTFVLARVFAAGSEMREDLEGTV